MYDLSIILPTCNRGELLEHALASIWSTTRCDYEVIVVDGASFDRTQAVLTEAGVDMGQRLKVIRETQREGFVRAANKGFAAATGRNVMWLNDDARPLPGSLDAAVYQLDRAGDDVGMLAMFHRFQSPRNVAFETVANGQTYRLLHIRGTLYANFGVLRTEYLRRLGCFDERYYINGADPDLSLKVWHDGRRVLQAYGALIDHDEHADGRRFIDQPRGQDDNAKLFAKWDLPAKNPLRNEFDPEHPCTLRGLRTEGVGLAA
jgi:GT2 family glycosyltransferase